jgi:hypothetical protein
MGSGAVLFILQKTNYPLDLENKWDMSTGYFIVSITLVFSAFFILRVLASQEKLLRQKGLLSFLGKNSLLFLYVHFPIILYLKDNHIHRTVRIIFQHPYLFWLVVLGLTLIVMLILLWLAKWKVSMQIFDHLPVWIMMTALVFLTGIFIADAQLTYLIEIGLGLLTALYYPRLANILKQKFSQPDIQVEKI